MDQKALLALLEERKFKELKEELGNMYPVDIAELLEEVDERQMILIFRLLGKEEAAETFTDMSSETREFLINALTDSESWTRCTWMTRWMFWKRCLLMW